MGTGTAVKAVTGANRVGNLGSGSCRGRLKVGAAAQGQVLEVVEEIGRRQHVFVQASKGTDCRHAVKERVQIMVKRRCAVVFGRRHGE